MKKLETPTPDTWTPEVAKHVQGYLECMTTRPWTQGSSTHEVVRHPDGYHVFNCHHGRDGQGAAYIVNAMPAAIARLAEAEKERDALSARVRELEGATDRAFETCARIIEKDHLDDTYDDRDSADWILKDSRRRMAAKVRAARALKGEG